MENKENPCNMRIVFKNHTSYHFDGKSYIRTKKKYCHHQLADPKFVLNYIGRLLGLLLDSVVKQNSYIRTKRYWKNSRFIVLRQ